MGGSDSKKWEGLTPQKWEGLIQKSGKDWPKWKRRSDSKNGKVCPKKMKMSDSKNDKVWFRKCEELTQKMGRSDSKMRTSDSEKWEGLTWKNGKVWLAKWVGLTWKSGKDSLEKWEGHAPKMEGLRQNREGPYSKTWQVRLKKGGLADTLQPSSMGFTNFFYKEMLTTLISFFSRNTFSLNLLLNPIQDEPCRGCSRMWGGESKKATPSPKYLTNFTLMKLGTIIPYLNKI